MMKTMKSERHTSPEFDAFTNVVDRVLSVPHSVIKQRVEAERKLIAANPKRPGPKTKRKKLKPSA
jgi:hypothetical protein